MMRLPALVISGLLLVPQVSKPPAYDLPFTAEQAYRAVAPRFNRDIAMDIVRFMQQHWRIAGNPGFNASIDHMRARLLKAGVRVSVDDYPQPEAGWDYSRGSVTLEGDPTAVLSKERDRVSLAINSFSTPTGGIALRLVDVGAAAAGDFDKADVKGAIVLGDAPLGRLWQQAVRGRGAVGVISTEIAPYIRPADPAAMSEAQKDVLQWGGIPYDAALKSFGFKASWRAASRLREALKRNPNTQVRVDIASTFHSGPNRTLIAEIGGRTKPNERIVIAAHVQEPGANDNATGCATLVSLVLALHEAIGRGALPVPDRTLTFLWLDEIRGSRQWLTSKKTEAAGVQYMFSMDMTGEDTAKTGGTFLIEKQADPSAVWPRPSDPHSEWGAGQVKADTLKGSLLNDVHLAIALRRARDTNWVVKTNPYEGGSDHTSFATAGIPSLLNWHFTDRYYHTNQDTTDKVSADEMRNVGVAVATSAYFLAAATEADALSVVDLLERAAQARLALERAQGPGLVAKAGDRAAAQRVEQQVLAAWLKWYSEAFDSVERLPASGATTVVKSRVKKAKGTVK
jgi:Zn-dependent M28 family amino/carboxypeptidase